MLSGKMLYTKKDGTYIIKLSGDVRVTLCASIDDFFIHMFEDQQLKSILIDVSNATCIDSTTLGMLAKVALKSEQLLHSRPTLVSDNLNITAVIRNMGFEQVFNILDKDQILEETLTEVPQVNCCEEEVCGRVLDAHKTLMQLNEKNRLEFTSVVKALESEQNALQDKY